MVISFAGYAYFFPGTWPAVVATVVFAAISDISAKFGSTDQVESVGNKRAKVQAAVGGFIGIFATLFIGLSNSTFARILDQSRNVAIFIFLFGIAVGAIIGSLVGVSRKTVERMQHSRESKHSDNYIGLHAKPICNAIILVIAVITALMNANSALIP